MTGRGVDCSPQYRSASGWNALLPTRNVQTLEGELRCDLAIVGAGYTGVAAARRWAQLRGGDSIAILDGSEVGEGNPGRNSGFLLEVALADDADAEALDTMASCNALTGETMLEMVDLVARSTVPCELVRRGTYRAAVGDAGCASLDRYRKFLEAARLPFVRLDRQALADRIGTGFYREGLYTPDCYLAQPAALIRALVDTLPDSVSVYERSPVTELARCGDGWELITPLGRVQAGRVILANNAFARKLSSAADRIVAMYTYAGLTEPLDAASLDELGSDPNWGLLPAHRLGSTLRRTSDGRLLVRASYDYEAEADPAEVAELLGACLSRRFPNLNLPPLSNVWSGATGYTHNGSPCWGALESGLFVSAGCNGGGVVKGTLFGRAIAELAANGEPPDIERLFGRASWLPPDPIRRWGFEVISRFAERHGSAER